MNRIQPDFLVGPTAYFTDFDYRLLSRLKNTVNYRRKAERKLKALLLLKTNVTFAASHLVSDFAFSFFQNNSNLLSSGAIVPAFRQDKADISELFDRKKFSNKLVMISFYKEHIKTTVNWDLANNSGWFRNRFVDDTNDPKSILRLALDPAYHSVLFNIVTKSELSGLLDRELIDNCICEIPLKQKRIIQNYRELLYHMSGARVINSESVLPQENYIDYDLADLDGKRTKLSEDQIFSKLLIEAVYDSLSRRLLPVDILDNLSFDDIIKIRQPLLETDFQNKYDALTNKVVDSYSERFDHIFDINELVSIQKSLNETFQRVVDAEMPMFIKKIKTTDNKELISNVSSVALGFLGFVPVIGIAAGGLNILKDSKALIVNLSNKIGSKSKLQDREAYYIGKNKLTKKLASYCDINNNQIIIEFIDYLTRYICEKVSIR